MQEKGALDRRSCALCAGEALDAYIAAGVRTDHESVTVEEMLEKYEKGMYVIVRRGSLKEPASAKELLEKVGRQSVCFCPRTAVLPCRTCWRTGI